MPSTHHDARPLTKEEGAQFYEHLRAIEALEAEKAEITGDINERKTLCCERLPVNKDVLNFVIKRRKAGKTTCGNFDDMLQLVEEAVKSVEHQRRNAGPHDPAPSRVTASDDKPDDAEDEDDSEDETEPELVDYNDPY